MLEINGRDARLPIFPPAEELNVPGGVAGAVLQTSISADFGFLLAFF
jgi:hypothetical protein